jgi:hypothetical protein
MNDNQQVRTSTVTIYAFKGYPQFYADLRGNFFATDTERPIPKQVNNGALCIRYRSKRYGVATLRKCAYLSEKIDEQIPF